MGGEWIEPAAADNGHSSTSFKYTNISSMPLLLSVNASTLLSMNKLDRDEHSFIIQPADLLVGLRAQYDAHDGNTVIDLDGIVTDLNGTVVSGVPVDIRILKDVNAKSVLENPEVFRLAFSSGNELIKQHLKVSGDSNLVLVATVRDNHGRPSRTIMDVSSSTETIVPANAAPLTISTNKDIYHPGDECRLRFSQPFESCNGFGALSTMQEIESFPIDSRTSEREVSIKIPDATNGKHLGIIKLFESKPIEKTSREAEGQFQICVEPKLQVLRLSLSCKNAAISNGKQKEVTLHVTDENNQPIPNANAILVAYPIGADGEFRDENFQFQLLNPTYTHLFASSLSRAPTMSDLGAVRKPITTFPNSLRVEKFVDRTFKQLPENALGKNVFPLQTLQTDAEGTATFVFDAPTATGNNTRICAFVMTQAGNGFDRSSLILPGQNSVFSESADSVFSSKEFSTIAKEPARQKFDNIEVVQSAITTLGEKNINFKDALPRSQPLAIAMSNSLLTPLAVSAERMIAETPQTTDLHGARLLTLLSLLPFVTDGRTQQRYKSAIAEDVKVLESLEDYIYPFRMSWIPANMKDRTWLGNEPPFMAPLLTEALLLAKQRGFFDWPSMSSFPVHLLLQPNSVGQDQSALGENTKALAYSGFVGSKISKFIGYPPLRSNFYVPTIVEKIREIPLEAIAWLMVYRKDVDFDQPTTTLIENRFIQGVTDELASADQVQAQAANEHKLRRLSAMLIAFLQFDSESQKVDELAKAIAKLLARAEYAYEDVERSYAATALADYYDHRRSIAEFGNATIRSKNRPSTNLEFSQGSPSIQVLRMAHGEGLPEITGTDNVGAGEISQLTDSKTNARNNGVAVKRTFSFPNAAACFVDGNGVWHCKAGASLTEHLEFVPTNTIDRVIVNEMRNVSARAKVEHLPKADPTAPVFRQENYRKSWPQQISQNSNSMTVYGSDIAPGVYSLTYEITFPESGTFKLPGVIVQSAYDRSIYGLSDEQTIVVNP